MKDLYRCLDEQPPELLQVLARVWGVPPAQSEPRLLTSLISGAMLNPQALRSTIDDLSAGARQLLGEFVAEDGVLPGHRLYLGWGVVRRLGPARMLREQPWLRPANASEELYYRGFVFRAYGVVGRFYGEVYLVPQPLLGSLEGVGVAAATPAVRVVTTPARIQGGAAVLPEELLTALVLARQGRLSAGPMQGAGNTTDEGVFAGLLGARRAEEWGPERAQLCWHLLTRLRFLQEGHSRAVPDTQASTRPRLSHSPLRPTLRSREWLRMPDEQRGAILFFAWCDDAEWVDMRWLPTASGGDPGWPHEPVAARKGVLRLLARCPADVWLDLDSFVRALRLHYPDFLRPEGDYDQWEIHDADGHALSGLPAWEHVEGELARHILTHPLYWLALLQIGFEDDGHAANCRPTAFRLDQWGLSLVAAVQRGLLATTTRPDERGPIPGPEDSGVEPGPAVFWPKVPTRPPVVTAVVSDDLTIAIPLKDSAYRRYQLERFCEWLGQDRSGSPGARARYRITEQSFWDSQNAGIKLEQIIAFLKEISEGPISPAVVATLLAWGGRFGRVTLRRVAILQTADEATMKQLTSRTEIRALVGRALSPTMCLVDQDGLEELTRLLQAMGIWPTLKG